VHRQTLLSRLPAEVESVSTIFRSLRHSALRVSFIAGTIFSLSLAISSNPLHAQTMDGHKLRNLSGIISSPDHEPLKGAIVELQEGDGAAIKSYITSQNGEYHFNRLNSDADYKVWVVFRTRHSKSKDISKFDDHLDKVIDFTVETF
jgi:hypothetical protein